MRKSIAILGAGALAFSLSACAGNEELPQPHAATESAAPALSADSFATVLVSIVDVVDASDAALDANVLAARTEGPFRELRTQEYALKTLLADSFDVVPVSTTPQHLAVTANTGVPREAVAVMEAPSGTNLKTINVFEQNNARDNWRLWGTLPILPGATVPGIQLTQGSATALGAESADGLVASPVAVLQAYAAYQQARTQDGSAITFGADALFDSLVARYNDNNEAVSGAGNVTMEFAAADDGVRAFATEDGGALVIGRMNFQSIINVTEPDATVEIGSTIGALATGDPAGKITVTSSLSASYSVMVAFHVPAAGSESTENKVVGASDPILMSVSNG